MPHSATLPGTDPAEALGVSQARAIAALLQGKSVTDSSKFAGVDRSTIHRWLRDDAGFVAALNAAKVEAFAQLRAEAVGLGALAMAHLRKLLDPETNYGTYELEFRAVQVVLKMIGLDKPQPVGPPDAKEAESLEMPRAVEAASVSHESPPRPAEPEPPPPPQGGPPEGDAPEHATLRTNRKRPASPRAPIGRNPRPIVSPSAPPPSARPSVPGRSWPRGRSAR